MEFGRLGLRHRLPGCPHLLPPWRAPDPGRAWRAPQRASCRRPPGPRRRRRPTWRRCGPTLGTGGRGARGRTRSGRSGTAPSRRWRRRNAFAQRSSCRRGARRGGERGRSGGGPGRSLQGGGSKTRYVIIQWYLASAYTLVSLGIIIYESLQM